MDPNPPCPPNFVLYNSTLCACSPGHYLSDGTCVMFSLPPGGDWTVGSAAGEEPRFLSTVFPFDGIRKFTQSRAVILESTAVVLLAWLVFCLVVRFGRIRGGRSVWFKIRWWISRLDVCYGKRHWLDDRKVVMKRRTELGGTLSIASLILFIGLFSALLYQIITKSTIEVHRVKPSNAPYFLSFVNDMEFNITTISSMSCSHLRDLGTLATGNPGFIDFRTSPLSTFANYSCHNTSRGPTITIKCNRCQVPYGNFYISWKFIDLPRDPATAVAFQFNLTAKDHQNDKRMSYVSGTVNSGLYSKDVPKTFRGQDTNVLIIHLFPQIYYNRHNLSIIQPLFHGFIPGSTHSEANKLQASLQSSNDGLINTTLYLRYLSDYIVEIDDEKILGPVSFLANVGGLYAFSVAIFLYFLIQCEYRFKKLRNEDIIFWNTISRNRAQRNWDKLRKYVMYTWDCNLDGKNSGKQIGNAILESFNGIGSQNRTRHRIRKDSIYLDKADNASVETINTNAIPEPSPIEKVMWSPSRTNSRGQSLSPKMVLGHEIIQSSNKDVTMEQSHNFGTGGNSGS